MIWPQNTSGKNWPKSTLPCMNMQEILDMYQNSIKFIYLMIMLVAYRKSTVVKSRTMFNLSILLSVRGVDIKFQPIKAVAS